MVKNTVYSPTQSMTRWGDNLNKSSNERWRIGQDRRATEILKDSKKNWHWTNSQSSSLDNWVITPIESNTKFVLDVVGGLSAFIGTILTTAAVFSSLLIYRIQRNFEHPSPSMFQVFKPLYRIAAVCYLFALSTQPTRIKFLLQRVSQIFQRKDVALLKNDETLAKTEHTFSKDMLITPLKILAAIGDILRK